MADVTNALAETRAACQYTKCLMDGVPNLGFVGLLIATENFARVIKAVKLDQHATVEKLEKQGNELCSTHWMLARSVRFRIAMR